MEETVLLALLVPKPSHPCLHCGHGVFDHGHDIRDTGCTECACPKFIDDPKATH